MCPPDPEVGASSPLLEQAPRSSLLLDRRTRTPPQSPVSGASQVRTPDLQHRRLRGRCRASSTAVSAALFWWGIRANTPTCTHPPLHHNASLGSIMAPDTRSGRGLVPSAAPHHPHPALCAPDESRPPFVSDMRWASSMRSLLSTSRHLRKPSNTPRQPSQWPTRSRTISVWVCSCPIVPRGTMVMFAFGSRLSEGLP